VSCCGFRGACALACQDILFIRVPGGERARGGGGIGGDDTGEYIYIYV